MKKNKFMRLASVMLMLCLITTCAISGTFAKYTTSASATDSARVAKWGVKVTMTAAETIFKEEYVGTDSKVTVDGDKLDAAAEIDVVAPGTNGTLSTIDVTGTPEVTIDVTTNLKLNLTGWTWDHDGDVGTAEVEYCPIVFTVGTQTYGLTGIKDGSGNVVDNECASVAALETAVINAILTTIYGEAGAQVAGDSTYETKKVVRYDPHKELTIDQDYSWEWVFNNDKDAADTALGNKAADDAAPTIDFAMSVAVDQVD